MKSRFALAPADRVGVSVVYFVLIAGMGAAGADTLFIRADVDGNRDLEITDATGIFQFLFNGEIQVPCESAADSNDSGKIDISDGIFTLSFLFLGGPEPSPPFPLCGPDPTPDFLRCEASLYCCPPGLTEVKGRILLPSGIPASGARASLRGVSAKSGDDGSFVLPDVPAECTSRVVAVLDQLRGFSGEVRTVAGGVTDAGEIVLAAIPTPSYLARRYAPRECSIHVTDPVVGDLDGDGRNDVVVADDVLCSHVQLPDGTFETVSNELGAEHALALQIVDLDRDGRLDVVTTTELPPEVKVLLGLGDGSFVQTFSAAVDARPSALAIADLDRDGQLDIVLRGEGSLRVTVFHGSGGGGFREGAPVAVNRGPGAIAAADFNEDGIIDLATRDDTGFVEVRLGSEEGLYSKPETLFAGNLSPSLDPVDLDLDGHLDLIAGATSGSVRVFPGVGDGRFSDGFAIRVGSGVLQVEAADLNNDGHLDLVVRRLDDPLPFDASQPAPIRLEVLLGEGEFRFQPAQSIAVPWSVRGHALADLDGDGMLDVIASPLVSFRGVGDGTFRTAYRPPASYRAKAVRILDLQGDGNQDLFVANVESATATIYFGAEDGQLQEPSFLYLRVGAFSIDAADLDGDNSLDLIIGLTDRRGVFLYFGGGDGSYSRQASLFAPVARAHVVAAGDLDHDGVPDIVVASLDAMTLSMFRGRGDGTFRRPIAVPCGAQPKVLKLGDIDGDGAPDAVLLTGSSNFRELSVFLGNGDGTFGDESRFPAPDLAESFELADVDGDGLLDALLTTRSPGFAVLAARPDGTFALPVVRGTTAEIPWSIAAGDLNGDAVPDVVTHSGTAQIYLGLGDGMFLPAIEYVAGETPCALALGDLDSDGRVDLVAADRLRPGLTVLFAR